MRSKSEKRSPKSYLYRKVATGQKYYERLSKWPSFNVVQKILVRLDRYRISSRSAETAFYLLLALVPFMIFLVSLLGLLSQSIPFRSDVLLVLQDIVPAPVFEFISDILSEIVVSQNVTFMSVSMLGFIWASSRGFTVILQGLNQIYSSKKSANALILRFWGLAFALLLVMALVVSAVLISFGDLIFHQIALWSGQAAFSGTSLQFARYLVSFIFLLIVFSLLYYLASHRKGGFIRSLPGAAYSAVCWLLFSIGFSWYINNFDRYARLYGSLASIIIVLFWLYFCSMMILTGGIIHELILERYSAKQESGAPQTEAPHDYLQQ